MWPGGVNDVMHRKRDEEGWLSELAEALRRVQRVVGGQMEKSA